MSPLYTPGGGGGGGTGPAGPAGADGATWRNGVGAPDNAVGKNGDYYLDTATGDVYKRASGVYGVVGNILGPQGPVGADGPQGPTGADGAQGPAGADGAQGPQGPAGTNGVDGADGATWRSGTTVPSNAIGVDGDLYLRTTTGDVYLRSAGAYSVTANIIGPQGPVGADGPQGPKGDTGATGAAGADGTNGTNGATWRSGAGAPSDALGVDGDFYLNTANGDAYKKAGGVYSVVVGLKGPTGAQGVPGVAVLTWTGTDYTPSGNKASATPKEFRGPTDPSTVSGVVLNSYDTWVVTP